MDKMTVQFLSGYLSQRVSSKLSLDMSQSVFITTMIATFLSQLDTTFFTSYFSQKVITSLLGTVFAGTGVYFFTKWYNSRKTPAKEEKASVFHCTKIYSTQEYQSIQNLMMYHPEFWPSVYPMEVGNPVYENMKGVWTVQEGHELPFDDKIHDVRGKIVVRGIEKMKDNPESKPLKCIELYIDSSCNITANKYIKNLDKYFEAYLEKNVPLKLYMIKVFRTAGGMQNLTSIMYRGNRNTTEERYKHYMMSYFSENREKIWNIVKTIQFKPENFQRFGQEPRVNMIFHGPPGTGKSSFVHRLAVCLGRHVVCLDLKSFSESKFSLYATLRKLNVENSSYEPHQYIILFEEFDIGFFHLLDKKKAEKKDPRADPSNSLEIEDLLELLQGPVPIPGGIIIATTNKYDEMSQIMPAMFRPGRLTPVFFGKMTWDSLQEMSMHYFNRELDIPRMDIDVSSAEIVETAISLSIQSTGKSFELFEDFIKKRVKIV